MGSDVTIHISLPSDAAAASQVSTTSPAPLPLDQLGSPSGAVGAGGPAPGDLGSAAAMGGAAGPMPIESLGAPGFGGAPAPEDLAGLEGASGPPAPMSLEELGTALGGAAEPPAPDDVAGASAPARRSRTRKT